MTFKVKSGINVGNINVIDSNSKYQQTDLSPVNKPTLILDFINTQAIDTRLTFARSSNGTFVSQRGLVETATAGVPRFDYANNVCQGILIEDQRTNYVTFSGDFTYSDWAKNAGAIVNRAATTAPDGSTSADIIISTGLYSGVYRFVGGLANNTTYTTSVYVKNISGISTVLVGCDANPTQAFVVFNFSTGIITYVGGSVTWSRADNIGNGWFRVGCSFTSTSANPGIIIYPEQAGQYAVWGPQVEVNYGDTSYIPSTETFISRSSNATYIDSTDNLIKTATTNVVRPLYNPGTRINSGRLLEPAATNLFTYSDDMSNAVWLKFAGTLSSNTGNAPDGNLTADKWVEDATSNEHLIYQAVNANNITQTFSVFVKPVERTKIYLGFSNFVNTATIVMFDLANNNIIATTANNADYTNTRGQITYVANGWFRCAITSTKGTLNNVNNPNITLVNAANNSLYLGDGTSGVFLWGAQLETGPYATSYIPTVASTVTKAADIYTSATTTRQYDSLSTTKTSWFDATQGPFAVEFESMTTTNSPVIIWSNISEYVTGRGGFNSVGTYDGANAIDVTNSLANTAVYASFGVSWSSTGKTLSLNGSVPAVNTNSTFSSATPTSFIFGGTTGGSRNMLGHIKRVAYYPQRVSNNELQALTRI